MLPPCSKRNHATLLYSVFSMAIFRLRGTRNTHTRNVYSGEADLLRWQ
jgi:hypothetical protein